MANLGARILEAGFGRPSGPVGRVGGRLMARGNAATERHLVDLADLSDHEAVLVVGPGPGVGLHAAALRCRVAVGVDPSEMMLSACRKRCADLVPTGAVQLVQGDAENTAQPDNSVDVVLSTNNTMLWPSWEAGFSELRRVLRPAGRMLISAHDKWLPGGLEALSAAVRDAGFGDIATWTWEPPGRASAVAAQLRAYRP